MGFQAITGESVIKDGNANYEKGWEAVNGKLFLTNRRLYFEAGKLNVQGGGIGIDLREIVSVRKCCGKFLGLLPILPGAVGVTVKGGVEHRFIVSLQQANWIQAIEAARLVHK